MKRRSTAQRNPAPPPTRAKALETLGLTAAASDEDIKRAYRRKAMKYHPDRHAGDAAKEARFKLAAEAYEVLKPGGPNRETRSGPPRSGYRPNERDWGQILPGMNLQPTLRGGPLGFIGLRNDGMVDVYQEDTYQTTTPDLHGALRKFYDRLADQPVKERGDAERYNVILGSEVHRDMAVVPLAELARTVHFVYVPGDFAEPDTDTIDPDDFE